MLHPDLGPAACRTGPTGPCRVCMAAAGSAEGQAVRAERQAACRARGGEPSSRRRRVCARWPLARRGGPGPGSQAHRDQARGDQVRGPARPRSPVGIATAQDSVGVAPTHVKHLAGAQGTGDVGVAWPQSRLLGPVWPSAERRVPGAWADPGKPLGGERAPGQAWPKPSPAGAAWSGG